MKIVIDPFQVRHRAVALLTGKEKETGEIDDSDQTPRDVIANCSAVRCVIQGVVVRRWTEIDVLEGTVDCMSCLVEETR